jgi:hypothetical protein
MQLRTLPADSSFETIIDILEKDGAVVLKDMLSDYDLGQLTEDVEHCLKQTPYCEGNFFGYKTKRVATMVAKSDVCQKMVLQPAILAVMDHFLLPHCNKYQLNLSQLISIGPGERQQIIHVDDPMFPFDNPPEMQVMLNVMWAIDDFTEENGATHIAPGSHLWARGERQPQPEEITQGVMAKGSCLIWLGSTHHGGGANRSSQDRRGIVMSYNLGWLKSVENYYLSIPLDVVRRYPKRLQELLGYFVHLPNLNTVEGRDPMELLEDPNFTPNKGLKEYMPSEAIELLERYYSGEQVTAVDSVYKHQA